MLGNFAGLVLSMMSQSAPPSKRYSRPPTVCSRTTTYSCRNLPLRPLDEVPLNTEEKRYPLEFKGRSYAVVEDTGQVETTADTGPRLPPKGSGWIIFSSDGEFVLRFESLSEDKETVLLRAREELAKRAAARRKQGDTSPHDRETPVTYSKKEVDKIRQMIVTPDADITCPRCNAPLESQTIAGGGTIEAVWELTCSECRRSMMVRDLPH